MYAPTIVPNLIKINPEAPPEWLLSDHPRDVGIRRTIGGDDRLPVCSGCNHILAGFKDGVPCTLDECPNCTDEGETP